MIMTDGLHDNFEPELLGKSPINVGLNYSSWKDIPKNESVIAKDKYRTKNLVEQINGSHDLKKIADNLMKHIVKVTEKQREYLELNTGSKIPDDYTLYPGKMDHSTCVNFIVPNL